MWDKIFAKSDKVEVERVNYPNRYGNRVSADLYVPKDMDCKKKYPALVIGTPYGGVKEQGLVSMPRPWSSEDLWPLPLMNRLTGPPVASPDALPHRRFLRKTSALVSIFLEPGPMWIALKSGRLVSVAVAPSRSRQPRWISASRLWPQPVCMI